MITIILLVFGFVLFVLSGLGIPDAPRFRLASWGLAFVTLALILHDATPLLH